MGTKTGFVAILVSILACVWQPETVQAKAAHVIDGGTHTYSVQGFVKVKQKFKFAILLVPQGESCVIKIVDLKSKFEFIPRTPRKKELIEGDSKFLYESVVSYSKNRVLPTMKHLEGKSISVLKRFFRDKEKSAVLKDSCSSSKRVAADMLMVHRGILIREIQAFLDRDRRWIDIRAKEYMRTGKY